MTDLNTRIDALNTFAKCGSLEANVAVGVIKELQTELKSEQNKNTKLWEQVVFFKEIIFWNSYTKRFEVGMKYSPEEIRAVIKGE